MNKEQKIIIKKLPAYAGSSSAISERCGEPGNIEIPEGWIVNQLSTTPIEKAGETKYVAVTMLLEKAD